MRGARRKMLRKLWLTVSRLDPAYTFRAYKRAFLRAIRQSA
jgi:hypothetical protein